MSHRAVILFNLGGPDGQDSVRPFLQNLFSDPAIIGAPAFIRLPLARFIAWKRAPKAKGIYAELGGGSPIVPQTEAQAKALVSALAKKDRKNQYTAHIVMRYWHPRAEAVIAELKKQQPDQIILLPLYPQFSTTTTGSSVAEWEKLAAKHWLNIDTRTTCCYPTQDAFIEAYAELIKPLYQKARKSGKPRILFSAHGLPKKIVAKGDPYQWQVEQTAAAIAKKLAIKGLDSQVCYQSRVGPLEWIGPSTDKELVRAGADKVPVVLVPLAFVSEHSETLVELDIEYKHLADESGVPSYHRVPTVGAHPAFISGLADLVLQATKQKENPLPHTGKRLCPAEWTQCPCRA